MEKRVVELWDELRRQDIKTKDIRLLLEAYRRIFMFNRGGHFKWQWLGLGYPSKYRSQYFRVHGTEFPRINSWYYLTDDGVQVMEKLIRKYPFPKRTVSKNKLNDLLFLV